MFIFINEFKKNEYPFSQKMCCSRYGKKFNNVYFIYNPNIVINMNSIPSYQYTFSIRSIHNKQTKKKENYT